MTEQQRPNMEKRRAIRIHVTIPTTLYAIGQADVNLHENLAKVYERVSAASDRVGERFVGTIRDLSTNGAFIEAEPLPLMSRVAFAFELPGFGNVEVLGWVLWRRTESCEVPKNDGDSATLPCGFGVLFEAIPLDARLAIHKMVSQTQTVSV